MSTNATPGLEVIRARIEIGLPGPALAPDQWIMWMPGGEHEIHATKAGKPISVRVLVDAGTAGVLQGALTEHAPQKAYLDFAHDENAASAWPLEFAWRTEPQPGVYARVEWSAAGRDAVSGRVYRSFSPAFFTEKAKADAVVRVTGAPLCMGGLVNDPAFKQILPLWARDAGAQSGDTNQTKTIRMTPEEIAALQAKLKQLEQENTALKAQASSTDKDETLKARSAEIEDLKQKIAAAEAALIARRSADAQAAVKAAVDRGALPPKDEVVQAKWTKWCTNSPEMIEALNALPTPAALQGKVAGTSAVTVTDEDPRDIAKAYGVLLARNAGARRIADKSAAGRDMALLYARAIRNNKRFGEMPVQAAEGDDTLGTLAGALVTQRVLDLVRLQLPALTRVTTDFSPENAAFGQTITTRIITVPGVETYSATLGVDNRPGGWTVTTPPTSTDVSLTINAHKGVVLNFDSNALAETSRRLFEEFAPGAAYALAKNMHDALLAVITKANFASPVFLVAPIGDFGRPTFSAVSAGFNAAGVPIPNRFALLNSTYWSKLTGDPTLVSLAVYQKPQVITDEDLPVISKFQPLECPNLPSTGDMAAFFGHKSSLLIAARVPNDYTAVLPGASNGRVQVISNPEDGLSVLLAEYVSHTGGYAERRISLMYGVAKGQTTCGRIITTK